MGTSSPALAKDAALARMKLLMAGPFPLDPGRPVGGVESAMSSLVLGLSQIPDIELEIIANTTSPRTGTEEHPFGLVTYLHVGPGINGWARELQGRMVREIRRRDADVVHIQAHASVAVRVPGSILTVHGIAERAAWNSTRGFQRASKSAVAFALQGIPRLRASRVISISEFTTRQIGGRGRQIWRIPNAIDPVFFSPDVESPHRSLKTFLYGGSIIPIKNVAGLIRAFAWVAKEDREAQLLLAGDGADSGYGLACRELVATLGLHSSVSFLGPQSTPQMRRLLGSAGTLVLFSDHENAPMIVAEALAMGTAVVATRVGAVEEMLQGLPGCALVHRRDENGLWEQIISRLQSVTEGDIGQLRKAAVRYSPESVAQATYQAYLDTLN
jgi:glycosyltransferase involved in cell wall biosynthesis